MLQSHSISLACLGYFESLFYDFPPKGVIEREILYKLFKGDLVEGRLGLFETLNVVFPSIVLLLN